MKRTLATMVLHGEYRVIHDDNKTKSPYSVHRRWNEPGEHGMRKRTKKLAEYDDLASCMGYLYWIACGNT